MNKNKAKNKSQNKNNNLPNGQVLIKTSQVLIGVMYFLGSSLWFLVLGSNLLNWYLGLIIFFIWGLKIREFRRNLEKYSAIGLRAGTWFLVKMGEEIKVFLNFNSVILPGMLLLDFKDESNQNHRFLIVPGMVSRRENFSWLSRYAKLSPVFQSGFFKFL